MIISMTAIRTTPEAWVDQVEHAGLHAPDTVYEQLLAAVPDRFHPMCQHGIGLLQGILAGRAFAPVSATPAGEVEFA